MELYTMDETFRRQEIIEHRKSTVWTERFAAPGEFQIEVASTEAAKKLLRPLTYINKKGSDRVMQIDTVTDFINEDGQRLLKVEGQDIVSVLDRRTCRKTLTPLVGNETWVFKDKFPADILREIFDWVVRNGNLSSLDKIPYLLATSTQSPKLYPADTIEEPAILTNAEISISTIAEAFSELLKSYPELGYRLYIDPNEVERLYFDVYTGVDRTHSQNTSAPVIFSLPWGTLANTEDLESTADFYNVCTVYSQYGVATATIGTPSGLSRRELSVTADETDEMKDLRGQPLIAYLTKIAEATLAAHSRVTAFDGEIPESSGLTYRVDYNLGDLVDLVGENNNGARMRVTEQIFTEDADGEKNYPTLVVDDYIDPDTWSGQLHNQIWETMPGYWGTV